YKVKAYLSYALIIKNRTTGRTDSSDYFRFVDSDSSKGYGRFYVAAFQKEYYPVNFSKTALSAYKFSVTGNMPLNARMIEGHLIFHYIDSDIVAQTSTKRIIDYMFAT